MRAKKPKTLQEAIVHFANAENCIKFMVARRWPDGVVCPTCGSKEVRFISTRRMWECKTPHPRKQFSAKIGTIFEDSPISLDKWLVAVWMIANCKNGVSSYEVARAIGVTQKSAWFMLHRIRLAMQNDSAVQLGGKGKEVEVDEAFIGGKARNMHRDVHARRQVTKGDKAKTPVLGILGARRTDSRTSNFEPQKEAVAIRSPKACRRWLCAVHRCTAVLRGTRSGLRASSDRSRRRLCGR